MEPSARWYARVCSCRTAISRQRTGAFESHQHYRNGLKVGLVENNGDELTQNLIALYAYMVRRLLHANVNNDASAIEEVENLLRNIADGWKEVAGSPQLIQDAV
jgi:flagellar biosynthetic protein FliS